MAPALLATSVFVDCGFTPWASSHGGGGIAAQECACSHWCEGWSAFENLCYGFVGLINATTVRMLDSLHAYSAHTTTDHYHLAGFQ